MTYLYLASAIVAEVIATSALKASASFTRPWPSALVVAGYLAAFYFLSLTLRTMSMGAAYAVWAGVGLVLITAVEAVLHRRPPDLAAVLGMSLIVAGVAVVNLFSKTVTH